MIEKPVIDLPEPDSPTRPSTLPALDRERATSSTALTTPALVKKCVRRPSTSSSGAGHAHRCSADSETSRNWSPTRLMRDDGHQQRDAGEKLIQYLPDSRY